VHTKIEPGRLRGPERGFAIILPFMCIGTDIGHRLHGKLAGKHLPIFLGAQGFANGISLAASGIRPERKNPNRCL
jgi:hypothetical protein